MQMVKKVASVVVGLFFLYILIAFGWSLLNVQHCKFGHQSNATCEEMAEDNAKNCEYVILKWKRVSYEEELKKCKDYANTHK